MVNKIVMLIKKYREMISYLFFGVVTTLVNFVVYGLLTDGFWIIDIGLGFAETPSQICAWLAAVLVAFITNKLFVFESRSFALPGIFIEFGSFFAARIFSGVIENGGFWLGHDILEFNDWWVKIALSVIVVITNYITGKFLVFRKKRAEKKCESIE